MQPTFIYNLDKALKQELPGKAAHLKMMVRPQYILNQKTIPIPAAVLILLYPIKKEWYFFLTKRTETVEYHKGQISLPGGMVEKNESFENTAIRETYEEIGIQPKTIKILGALTPFYIPVSGFEIFPYVGWIKNKPKLTIQNKEVAKVFSLSIKDLMQKKIKKEKESVISGHQVKIPFFQLKGEMIWGATSMIISEFKYILKGII